MTTKRQPQPGLFDPPALAAPATLPTGAGPIIRVIDVHGIKPGDPRRLTTVYVGRHCYHWASSRWRNRHKPAPGFNAVKAFARDFLGRPVPEVEADLAAMWEETRRGELPIGCWCCEWTSATDDPEEPAVCHGVWLARMLVERFVKQRSK